MPNDNLIKQFKKNIEIDYGIDNTGDLYNVNNISTQLEEAKGEAEEWLEKRAEECHKERERAVSLVYIKLT